MNLYDIQEQEHTEFMKDYREAPCANCGETHDVHKDHDATVMICGICAKEYDRELYNHS